MSDVRAACTSEQHEALKVDPAFRTRAEYIGVQVAGDLRIELRQCPLCGSTLGVVISTGRSEPPRSRGGSRQGQRSIVIVDDDAAIREALREALEDEDYSVLEAEDGVRGLELLSNAHPALVLLDLYMPNLDGYHFVEEMRRDP